MIKPGMNKQNPGYQRQATETIGPQNGEISVAQGDAEPLNMITTDSPDNEHPGQRARQYQAQSPAETNERGHRYKCRQFHEGQYQQQGQQPFCHIHRRFSGRAMLA